MLYSSYFAIFGALFGFQNFGKMVAIDNTFNGLVGLLQLPFTYWALNGLGGDFTLINCLQVDRSLHAEFTVAVFCEGLELLQLLCLKGSWFLYMALLFSLTSQSKMCHRQ